MAGEHVKKEKKPRPDTVENAEGTGTQGGLEKPGMEQTGRQEGTEDTDRPNSLQYFKL